MSRFHLLVDTPQMLNIDRRYPLSEVPEALRYYGKRRPEGKVIIAVEQITNDT